jgi:hypothetical protein
MGAPAHALSACVAAGTSWFCLRSYVSEHHRVSGRLLLVHAPSLCRQWGCRSVHGAKRHADSVVVSASMAVPTSSIVTQRVILYGALAAIILGCVRIARREHHSPAGMQRRRVVAKNRAGASVAQACADVILKLAYRPHHFFQCAGKRNS